MMSSGEGIHQARYHLRGPALNPHPTPPRIHPQYGHNLQLQLSSRCASMPLPPQYQVYTISSANPLQKLPHDHPSAAPIRNRNCVNITPVSERYLAHKDGDLICSVLHPFSTLMKFVIDTVTPVLLSLTTVLHMFKRRPQLRLSVKTSPL